MNQSNVTVNTYNKAICLPCTGAENGLVAFGIRGGICRADRTPIPEGFLYWQHTPAHLQHNGTIRHVRKDEAPVNQIQIAGDIGETKHVLSESYIYAGLLFTNLGHFLMESLSRLWFIKQNPDTPMLWVNVHGSPELRAFQKEILELLGVKNPIHILTEQSEVEELIVPPTGSMFESEFSTTQKEALKVFDPIPLKPGKKLWLSRKNLANGRFLNEIVLENILISEGWSIFHPEDYSVTEQLHYRQDAEHIAGIAGSAYHLIVLLGSYQGQITLFARGPSIQGDFINIADRLNLNLTIWFENAIDCTPKLPRWVKHWYWTDLHSVLNRLGISVKRKDLLKANAKCI